MSKLHLSVSSTDEVDDLAEGIEISSGDVASFELDDQEAMSLYHFIRQCLLLENKITIEVTGNEGQLLKNGNQEGESRHSEVRDVLETFKQRIVADLEVEQSEIDVDEGTLEDSLKVALYEISKLEQELSGEN